MLLTPMLRSKSSFTRQNKRRITPRTLPSAIEMLLAERPSPNRAKKLVRDKRFMRDLKDQALSDLTHFPYVDTLDCTEPLDPDAFAIFPAADLSPLLPEGKCACAPCRVTHAKTFVRSTCLYADVVVLSDHFSGNLIVSEGDGWTGEELVLWFDVLESLEPLMRAGVIRFSRWVYSRCKACGDVCRRAEREIAQQLFDDIMGSQFSVSFHEHEQSKQHFLALDHPLLAGPQGQMFYRMPTTPRFVKSAEAAMERAKKGRASKRPFGKQLKAHLRPRVMPMLRKMVDAAVFSSTMGQLCGASTTIATDSAWAGRVLARLDHLDRPLAAENRWELPPTTGLPWLRDLTANTVLDVRDEASSALPAFRALLRSRLFVDAENRTSTIQNLQAEVAEIENELRTLKVVRRRSTMLSLSGLLLAVYGFGTRDAAMIGGGLGGFLSTLAAAHQSVTEAELTEHRLAHKPAYLMLSAKSVSRRHPRSR